MTDRDRILDALRTFAESRPGLDFANYGDISAYRSESRAITRDLHDARALLAAVAWRGIEAPALRWACAGAFSGRLALRETPDSVTVDYCTGQYYPTEYRKAVCAVLAAALWAYWRDECGQDTADKIRKYARRELGANLARRWFNG